MSNNGNVFIQQVKADLIGQFKKNAVKLSNQIDKIQQDTIDDFEAVDTGLLQLKTFTKFQTNLTTDIIAEASFITRGVDYAQYVIDGSGTNRKYGKRNYLETARDQTAEQITTGKYTRIFKRGASPKSGKLRLLKRTF